MRDSEFIRFLLDKKCLIGNTIDTVHQPRQRPSPAFTLTRLKAKASRFLMTLQDCSWFFCCDISSILGQLEVMKFRPSNTLRS